MPTEIHLEPTLFIGAGSTGGHIAAAIRRQLQRSYGDLPSFGFLAVDADETSDPALSPALAPAERAVLSGFNADEVLANLPRFPAIQAWLPATARLRPGMVRFGAGQVRPLGRLAFFRKYGDRGAGLAVADKLQAACERLRQIDLHTAAAAMSDERYRFVVERGARVVLLSSTCGGAGSSILWDLAYLCRGLLRGTPHTITAVLLLPPVIDAALRYETQAQRDKIRANTYAWFLEHQSLLAAPRWRVAYPEGAPLDLVAKPFDETFVLDITNQAGDRLASADEVYAMAASALVLATGSPLGGALRSFQANVSVLDQQFQGRPQSYSSFATAALIYPADRVVAYAGARHAFEMIRRGLLARPGPAAVAAAAAALVGRLGLAPDSLAAAIQADVRLPPPLDGLPGAATADDARRLVAEQEARDADQLQLQERRLEALAANQLAICSDQLDAELRLLLLGEGPLFVGELAHMLLTPPPGDRPVAAATVSLDGLRRLLLQGFPAHEELARAEGRVAAARERVARLGRGLPGALARLSPRARRRRLEEAREAYLRAREGRYALRLRRAALRAAASVYDRLADQTRQFQLVLGEAAHGIRGAGALLRQSAAQALAAAPAPERFQLTVEVLDGPAIRAFYERHGAAVDPLASYRAFARELAALPAPPANLWDAAALAERLRRHAEAPFAALVARRSLLEALAEQHGEGAPAAIAGLFERAVRFCHPFWRYDANSGIDGQEGRSIIGLFDASSPLLPAAFKDAAMFELKSTGFLHRVDILRVQHGVPAFLLHSMDDYKAAYERRRAAGDSLHVLPGVEGDDLFPHTPQGDRSRAAD